MQNRKKVYQALFTYMGLLKNYNLKKKEQHPFQVVHQKLGQCVRLSTTLIAHAPAAFSAARRVFKAEQAEVLTSHLVLLEYTMVRLQTLVSTTDRLLLYQETGKTWKQAYKEQLGFLILHCQFLSQILNEFFKTNLMVHSWRLELMMISSRQIMISIDDLTSDEDFERSLANFKITIEHFYMLQKIVESPAFFTAIYKCPLSWADVKQVNKRFSGQETRK